MCKKLTKSPVICNDDDIIYPWDLSKFITHENYAPRHHWDNLDNQRAFMDNLCTKLGLTDRTGWYKITGDLLSSNHGRGLLLKYRGSVGKLLCTIYPEYKQFCREEMLKVMNEKNLSSVDEILHLPKEYL